MVMALIDESKRFDHQQYKSLFTTPSTKAAELAQVASAKLLKSRSENAIFTLKTKASMLNLKKGKSLFFKDATNSLEPKIQSAEEIRDSGLVLVNLAADQPIIAEENKKVCS